MRRHSILARLGPADTEEVKIQDVSSLITELRFIDGRKRLGYGFGQLIDELKKRGIRPTEDALDLAVLAGAVTAADTRISRERESQDSWTREIDLYVPVKRCDTWESARPLLERMLHFLTGDEWRLFFRGQHKNYDALIKTPRSLIHPPFSCVCLFSGGLDSFTGAIDLLESGEKPLFVSHYWDASTSSQTACAKALGNKYGKFNPRHARARIGFADDLIKNSVPENTLRARSFLFFAQAALATSGLKGTSTIYVPENGLISLNVPLDPLRLGAWSTRTTHPFYIARWQDLLDHFGFQTTMVNPYRFMTKGEMLSNCKSKLFLQQHVAQTISCSSYTKGRYQGLSHGHCGYCVPCLIRRASIEVAYGSDPTTYIFVPTLSARTLDAGKPEGEHIRSFQLMAARLKKKPGLEKVLIHISGPLGDYSEREKDSFAEVFRRGIQEVGIVLSSVNVKPL